MQFSQANDTYIIYLLKNEKIMHTLTQFCKDHSINNAQISGIGAVKDIEIGAYDLNRKEYITHKFIDDISVISIMTQAESLEELKDLGSALINKISKGAVVLGGMNEKPMLLICLTNNLVEDGYSAAIIAKDLGKQMGAGGGGRPNMATAGGKDENGLRLVVEKGYDYLKNYFKG